MYLPPYEIDELAFAYCCHVYYRWQSYRRRIQPAFGQLTADLLRPEHSDVHILEMETSDRECAILASLYPTASPAVSASKLKGATSKLVRQLAGVRGDDKLLATGYFAATSGKATSRQLDKYLDSQSIHHGYESRARPPTYVRQWPIEPDEEAWLKPKHSLARIQWHIVLATWDRKGTFSRGEAAAVCQDWEERLRHWRLRLRKVSFLPDHVHVALRTHPSVAPAEVALELMNRSQDLMVERFSEALIPTGSPRVWKPSAYIGSYGDLSTRMMQAYMSKLALT